MAAIGGIFVAHAGMLTRTPTVVFYDTENAKLQNLLTYPFASLVVAPRAYEGWLPRKSLRYNGYHELSYLHPSAFRPDRTIAINNGLAAQGDTFFLKLVTWQANHDVGERGWDSALLEQIIAKLSRLGRVLISLECPLPAGLSSYAYNGNAADVHHVMAYSRLFVGESATMASECAVLGTPAIYAANTGRGYTNEQERRYGLVKNISKLERNTIEAAIDTMLSESRAVYAARRQRLLDETIPVASFVAETIERSSRQPSGA